MLIIQCRGESPLCAFFAQNIELVVRQSRAPFFLCEGCPINSRRVWRKPRPFRRTDLCMTRSVRTAHGQKCWNGSQNEPAIRKEGQLFCYTHIFGPRSVTVESNSCEYIVLRGNGTRNPDSRRHGFPDIRLTLINLFFQRFQGFTGKFIQFSTVLIILIKANRPALHIPKGVA